jgi:hypothetical protein
MFRFVVLVFCMQFLAGMASAQWVSSGSGIGERSGDQGLTSPDVQAQSIGFSSVEDMEAAAALGYEASAADASVWVLANNDSFDEDCQRLFGSNCEEVDASEFRPVVPQILTLLGLGFENLTEMETYVDTVDAYGGDETDAANCKAHQYAASEMDGQLCMMATNDNDNAPACRASLGVPISSPQDCSDLDRDDYEAIAYNMAPEIIVPADWSPTAIPGTASPGDTVISVLRATDPEGDELTWSITAMDLDVFSINATTGVVTLAEASEAPSEQPESVSLTVQVSDGALSDNLTLQIALQDLNRPPQIILPADWTPSIIPHDTQQGTNLVNQLAATDPDGDVLTWSISASDLDILAINPQSGVLTLARENGLAGLEQRPESIRVMVQVSDGHLSDEQALSIPLEAEKVNTPPEIIVPAGFAASDLNPHSNNVAVGMLEGRDPDEDTLTWSLIAASPAIFTINAQTGDLSHNGLDESDTLSCQSAAQASASAQVKGRASSGIVSTNANVIEDHSSNDFRSKKTGGKHTTTGKYHVFLERSGHRGGSFTTEARSAEYYDVTNGSSVYIPALRSAKVNSSITPINSYLVYQNNAKVDFSNKEAVITFANPIVGVYFTDNGFDSTIDALGKPGALYSRKRKVNKLALEDGRDIAWVDPIDSRVLRFRSKTSNVGDFMRVLTTASNTSTSTSGGSDLSDGPDTCSATVTVQLSDGQATAEETLTLAFADPNRAPQVFTPTDWTPSTVSNANGAGDLVVSTLGATDPDGDILKWSLDGADANLFSIGSFDGKISLSQAYGDASSLPSNANVTVRVTDGRLSDTLALNIPIEEKQEETSMASNVGTNGNFQFVSEDVQNIFNQDYTIMARFFHGSTGYSKPYFDYKKYKWINQSPKETIFFWGGNRGHLKFLSGLSLHVVGDTIRLQLGSDGSYLETRAPIQRNRWHTVMFAVDADQRRKTKKHNWPVKMYLNGRRVGLNEFSFETKNKGYKPIGTPEGYWTKTVNSQTGNAALEANNLPVAAIGIAGTVRPVAHWGSIQRRHLPLRGSSFIHEVSIWQGDKSSVASAIYNNNRDVADYASTSVGKPRYSWKPGLLGQSKSEIHCGNMGGERWNNTYARYTCLGTPAGEAVLEANKDWTCGWRCNPDPRSFVIDRWEGTLTLANLANGANPKNGKSDYVGPTAGNGTHRLDGDMHLYSGGLTFETEVYHKIYRKRMTGIIIPVPQVGGDNVCRPGQPAYANPVRAWHQGDSYAGTYLSALKKWHGWSSNCENYNDDDIKAFATRAMSGKTKPLN